MNRSRSIPHWNTKGGARNGLVACWLLATSCLAVAAGAEKLPTADWWSLKPLVRPAVPTIRNPQSAIRNPIDAFIAAKLAEKKLPQSPEADARALIRRRYFDLIGLPPKPEEVERFVAHAARNTEHALESLVDELLASPHHGERWARHWLDVVHYGDTHGYDKDKPRPNAWPYRDYVIRAFNSDKPYARFVQEQLAGDVLFPGTQDGIEALGFIAAGPWDFIGHAELPETKIDGKIARHLDRDDMVANTMNTFASLTVQCAQCHNHKFDPIPQADYYSLQAVFAALDRADKTYDADPVIAQRRAELLARQRELKSKLDALNKQLAAAGGRDLDLLDKLIRETRAGAAAEERPEFGWHSQISAKQDMVKWVQVDLGARSAIEQVVYVACHDNFNNIGAGFGFPVRFKVEASDDAKFEQGVTLLEDQTKSDVPNPGVAPRTIAVGGKPARFLRFTATKLAPRQNDFIFALAEVQVLDKSGKNLALGAAVTSLDSIEALPRWSRKNLTDGYYYGARKGQPATRLADLEKQRADLVSRVTNASLRAELAAHATSTNEVAAELAKLPAPKIVYAGTVHHGTGSFRGTGTDGGKPRTIHVLNRGDVKQPKDEAAPGALSCIAALPASLALAPTAPEGERRAALAKWLSSPDNPLVWRSIVNRVWQHHFGRGLVDTPNDFGRMGALPTHPELLDWLACEFRDSGGSFKKLHKLIVMSATYRQSSTEGNEGNKGAKDSTAIAKPSSKRPGSSSSLSSLPSVQDSDNRFLWRQNRRKLDAESIRDSVLFVSGKLDARMGGPAFQDFVIEKPEHSPHYEYHLHDPDDPKAHRRSIYRFIVRSHLQPFMTTLDCADPSISVSRRNESVSALQALALLNNGLMVTMSKHFAAKLDAAGGDTESKVKRAFTEALGRTPTAKEAAELTAFAHQHGLANTCRLLFNMNEFAFVD
jgi:multidrug efflux pump subunit AcrA (membrane-fusion protein)